MFEITPDYLKPMAEKRLKELENLKTYILTNTKESPQGKLLIQTKPTGVQYYLRTDPKDTHGKYIKEKDKNIAYAIAQYDYLIKLLPVIEKLIKSIQAFKTAYVINEVSDIYEKLSDQRKELVVPVILDDNEFTKRWEAIPYEGKAFEPGDIVLYNSKEQAMRSKSEIMISEALIKYKVPYRYEYPLNLKGIGTVHPDFYCLNKRLRREIPWEHFGLMERADYAKKNINKLEKYELNGYFPGNNFIMTMETTEHPLDERIINKTIEKYLL